MPKRKKLKTPKDSLTPAMRQWKQFKDLHPDKILLFRMGDFYEMFGEDARVAAEALEIAITTRDRGKEDPMPMCGIPHHALEAYLGRLIRAGHKAALCEQLEDPSQAKGIVRRGVTRVITPGTVLEEGVMEGAETVLLAAWYPSEARAGLAWADLSSGALRVVTGGHEETLDRLRALEPREVLIPEGISPTALPLDPHLLTPRSPREFKESRAADKLARRLELPAHLPGLPPDPEPLGALLALTGYIEEVGGADLHAPEWEQSDTLLAMDEATRRNLELTVNMETGGRTGTLFEVLNGALTPMGIRLVRDWILTPPAQKGEVLLRQAHVTSWFESPRALDSLRETLRGFPDLARVTARLAAGIASPRDVGALRDSLTRLPKLREICLEVRGEAETFGEEIPLCEEWRERLTQTLLDTLPHHTRDGNLFSPGTDPELDRLRNLSENAHGAILELESREKARTGIGSMKVKYNKVFGYFLEVSKSNLPKVPDDYERRQTLVGNERFVTGELKQLEAEILSAREERERLELRLWNDLLEELRPHVSIFREVASLVARLDALSGLARRALERGYVRPEITEEPRLDIHEGRHPVLESDPRHQPFVPNSTLAEIEGDQLLLITGPNMGGKSTYLRQTALLAIMAHLGSYVPAERAVIGLSDRLFCRVGAGDSLLRGLSTFMVEMTETAAILKNATRRSLVFLDEVGRGTSTYDGLAIAWAVVEALSREKGVGCRTLFATHYHELTQLGTTMDSVKNLTMGVREHAGRVIFLRTVLEGAADRSYGIHVAELAGVPDETVTRARQVLLDLESRRENLAFDPPPPGTPYQPSLFGSDPREEEALRLLREADTSLMTPLEALNLLDTLSKKLGKE